MKSNKMLAVAAVTAVLVLPLPALAGPVTTGTNTQTFSFEVLTQNTAFSFAGFNSHLGVLNSVHLDWILNKTLSASILNNSLAPLALSNVTASSITSFAGSGIAALLTGSNTLSTTPFTGNAAAAMQYFVAEINQNVTSVCNNYNKLRFSV